ncbi:putative signal transduction histidine kinase [Candidatus Vecturithrix granuli]|uniref:histidine kinase n=1 Tax=Vecturithrix granuli TaxID=1499967 RepID=A0A081C2C7_VECG1|nr:putative signal transduction histidine kinase [Candidatus Vecturithrix granuli]
MNKLRQRAEAMVQGQSEGSNQFSAEEIQRTIHELRVHQIELELQNEELRRSQLEIQESRDRYADLYDFAPVGYLTVAENGQIIEANLTCAALCGIERASLLKLSISHLISSKDQDIYYRQRRTIFDTRMPQTCELRMRSKEQTTFYAHLTCAPVLDHEGNVTHIRIAITDQTRRRLVEEQLQLAMREIHHRTKNNMVVIQSLLYLQAESIQDPQVLQIFQKAQDRIHALALVHEKLYRSDLVSVNLKDYIADLASTLLKAYQINSEKITLTLNTEPILAPIDFAVSFGLILNELISNILKYAFPENRDGEISLSLHAGDRDTIELDIRDNGVGLPQDFEHRRENSLGFQLVTMFANQIHGVVEYSRREPGTEVRICFKQPCFKKRI